MKLLLVELTRLRWRRAILILLALCFVVPALIFATQTWDSRPYSAAEMESLRAEQTSMFQGQIDDCIDNPEMWFGPADDMSADEVAQMCNEMMGDPEGNFYLERQPLDLAQVRHESGFGVITVLLGLVMLIGTTFVGHDWNSGSMSNQLLFEPRRLRVWGAKAFIVFTVGLAVSALALAAYWGALNVVSDQRNLVVAPETWELIRESAARGALIAAAAGLGAYAMTMLFRSTVATLGIMFGVSVAGSILTMAILGNRGERWLLPTNLQAFVMDGYEYWDPTKCGDGAYYGDEARCMTTITQGDASVFFLVLLVLGVALSVWSFRRRDVP